jgi:very-short-patch-repair endonuclease
LRAAVRQAERVHRLDLSALRDRVATPRTDVAHGRLFALLSAYVPETGLTDSELEARFFELCARHRLPTPERQVAIGSYRVDFLWRDLKLVVETDGRETHDSDVAFLEDRVKDRALTRLGYEVLRFTWAEVTLRPGVVAAEVRAAIRRRQGRVELSSSGRR